MIRRPILSLPDFDPLMIPRIRRFLWWRLIRYRTVQGRWRIVLR